MGASPPREYSGRLREMAKALWITPEGDSFPVNTHYKSAMQTLKWAGKETGTEDEYVRKYQVQNSYVRVADTGTEINVEVVCPVTLEQLYKIRRMSQVRAAFYFDVSNPKTGKRVAYGDSFLELSRNLKQLGMVQELVFESIAVQNIIDALIGSK